MLNQPSVDSALRQKRDQFHEFAIQQAEQQKRSEERLTLLQEMDRETVLQRLGESEWPGAIPTTEFDRASRLCFPLEHDWNNHQEARVWARQILENRTTVAVDGSQIVPSTDFLPLVGATQIGWFVNQHNGDRPYIKDLSFTVLPPSELNEETDSDDESVAVQTVNQVRFAGECDKLRELMFDLRTDRSDAKTNPIDESVTALAFFDGSFIISFAGRIRESRAEQYIGSIRKLLTDSERFQVPLVGFVDSSRSRDVVSLINTINQGSEGNLSVSDGMLFDPMLKRWGDRSPLFICARDDGLSSTSRGSFYTEVVFCYMRLSRDKYPARIEMPIWLHEAGLVDDVLDIVRAECVVGTGYPYAIETADALAVISQQDRRRFYALLQRFLDSEGIRLIQTRKSQSKQTRR